MPPTDVVDGEAARDQSYLPNDARHETRAGHTAPQTDQG